MQETKEMILLTALRLFARKGYEAVSISDIAGELGMAKSALYKHYQGKRDVFDSILARMQALDGLRAQAYAMPEGTLAQMTEAYRQVSVERLKSYTLAQLRYWTEEEFPAAFRKMLLLEQYRSPAMAALYQQYLGAGPLGYLADLFREMARGKPFTAEQARQWALAFYGPIYLLIGLRDGGADEAEIFARARAHLDQFFKQFPWDE